MTDAAGPRADGLADDAVALLLRGARCVAVVGLSPRPDRPSHGVVRFLLDRFLGVVGVDPAAAGLRAGDAPIVATLAEAPRLPAPPDIVDVFPRAPDVSPVADDAIAARAGAIRMQLGIVHHAAAARARAAGLRVVVDRRPVIEWRRLGLPVA